MFLRSLRLERITVAAATGALLLASCWSPAPVTPGPRPGEPGTFPTLPASPTVPPGEIRQATVAGSWYPSEAAELRSVVGTFLLSASRADGEPIALIVPHAGFAYSGQTAAIGFRQLQDMQPDVVVIIASDHQAPLSDPVSVWAEGGFETPLGIVPVDVELAQALVAADPRIRPDLEAHRGEHPIEIELPFLQAVCPTCTIVPILMGASDEETVHALSQALITHLEGRNGVVVASSDLSHYPSYEDALTADAATLAAIESGDPERLRAAIAQSLSAGMPNLVTCACGEGPILVAMQVAQGLGADTVTTLQYMNSGDSPYGDKNQVVGYGAVMFWRYEPPSLSPEQQQTLLEHARYAIAEHLRTGQIPNLQTSDPGLMRHAGAFVTLMMDGELRGCVGRLQPDKPLDEVVRDMAIAAAVSDLRFPALKQQELDRVKIEISVLSPLRRVTVVDEIQLGTHGLMILHEGRQGVFLPQVPTEEGWDLETYLSNLCLKAGLPADCMQEQPALYSFTARVFGEE